MEDKTRNIVITIGFIVVLMLLLLVNIVKQDEEISISERRKLAQFPEITYKKIINGEVSKKIEDYTIDQFVKRDVFRGVKLFFSRNILRQKDNNGLFEKNGAIYKMEYPLNKNNVNKSFDKINEIYEKYLENMNVYYAIIPDKNYYLSEDEHLRFDYDRVKKIALEKLNHMQYIDIWSDLELDDYYKTDLHWKQENLSEVVKKLQTSMKNENVEDIQYIKTNMGKFYGTYYGQLGVNVNPDQIYILTNDIIKNCKTYDYEKEEVSTIYNKSNSKDKYDIYLSGATPLIHIENPNANGEKELLIFRDSYGSSLAPLLIQNYRKITLIDLRYISSALLENYIEFNNQDVLFLYSTLVLNQNVLK